MIILFFCTNILLSISCKMNNSKSVTNKTQSSTSDTLVKTTFPELDSTNQQKDNPSQPGDDSSSDTKNTNEPNMLAQGMSAMFGKNDSGLLQKMGGGKNMDSMMQKMQSMGGGKNGNPGDALSKLILDAQLGGMKDDNPIKSVAKGMQKAQENGTAGPTKTYSAVYTPEQPDDYSVPVSGSGNSIMLQYSGGTISNGKKDGLWKNVFISTIPGQWNVFTEGFVTASSINMKVHATSLASVKANYSINLNEQYKKYAKQYRTESGKYEYDVQVQKMNNGKMFGYNCTHILVSYTVKALGQTSQEQNEEWYSADVPGAQYVSPLIFENHAPAVVKKIMDAGCAGVLVKSLNKAKGSSYVMQLTSITKKDMPSSLFSIPANYVLDKNTALYDIQ